MSQIVVSQVGELVAAFSLLRWVLIYTRLQPWWRDPDTRELAWTLVAKDLLLASVLAMLAISSFFRIDSDDRRVLTWIEIVLVLLIAPVMEWRTRVWKRESRRK